MREFLRHFFFFHVSPLVVRGQKKILEFEDLLESPKELDIDRSLKTIPLDISSEGKLILGLIKEQKHLVIKAWSFYSIGTLASLSTPFFVNRFITKLSQIDATIIPIALGIGLIGIFMGIGYQHNFYNALIANLRIIARINRQIFEHALRLNQSSRQKIDIGDVVNHMSSDSESLGDLTIMLGDLGWATTLLIGSVSMLFYYLGWTAFVAVGILAVLAPVTGKLAKRFIHLEDIMMKKRDRRVSLMGQLLQSMRLVKYFVWEKEIQKQVGVIRADEIAARKKLATAEMISGLSFVGVSTLVLFVSLWVHVLRGEVLTPALVLTCVSLFGLLQEPIGHLPGVLSRITNAWVSARRIISFLEQATVSEREVSRESGGEGIILKIKDMLYQNPQNHFKLGKIDFELKKNEMIAIVGPIGSGKSTLLQAILGEISPNHGYVQRQSDNIGYVSQESYIMNASILDNIKMGKNNITNEDLELAIALAALSRDISQLPGGLNTEIGEKGVNLSGGQKQRLSLARCFLQNPDLILLDDPLSAVDVHTEKMLMQNLLLGAWKNKARVVVTHRLEQLDKFDRIIFLNKGEVLGIAPLGELLNISPEFKIFFSHYQTIEAKEEKSNDHNKEEAGSEELHSKLMTEEDREQGAVNRSLYWEYIKALGGSGKQQALIVALLITGVFLMVLFPLGTQWWLTWFTSNPEKISQLEGIRLYGVAALISLIFQMANKFFWLKRGIKAGIELHDNMLKNILKAPVRFFDTTPVGRLLQRFSRDLEAVDFHLQWSFESALQCFFQIVVALGLIVFSVPYILIVIVPIGLLYWKFQLLYRASAREAKRMDSIFRSPRFAHFKETLNGLPVIRAYKKEAWFRDQFFNLLEKSQRATVNNFLLNRWFSMRIPIIGGIVSGATAFALIYSVDNKFLSPSTAGLVVIYSMSFWGALNWGIRILSELESRMTSIERIKFMTNIEPEKAVLKSLNSPIDSSWPFYGEIKFNNVRAKYDTHLPEVIKGLDVVIPAKAQVGIIGRTGAGKTTLFQLLYRFINLHQGVIEIDGIDIASVDLNILRSRLAIIPQDPILFVGTLRDNLDPYNKKSDEDIWRVLRDTGLDELVLSLPGELLSEVSDGGNNLSQGQRQLFCLARALLLDSKIIMLDEATASVDVVSDAKIQKILRRELKNKTVLVIAHRLATVSDLDFLLVMNDGKLESFSKTRIATLKADDFGLKD